MSTTANLTWTHARDGSRTAKQNNRWLGGCSVPRRSAEMMLRKLQVKGNVVCLLLPIHAQQIEVLLNKLDQSHAVIVIVNEETEIGVFQACHDHQSQLGHRLFFAWDASSLHAVFDQNPGLPIPQQFIRLPTTPQEFSDQAIKWAQPVLSAVSSRQVQSTITASERWNPTHCDPLVMIQSRFSLWNDAGHTLATVTGAKTIDLSDARQTSNSFIAQIAANHASLISVDLARADHKDLIHPDQPWITWITKPRVPAYLASSPHDALMLTDPGMKQTAISLGWPENRLVIADHPRLGLEASSHSDLSMICDLPSLNPPELVQEFSSWRLVWEAVQKDLIDNPHRMAGDVGGYLEKARKYFGIPATNFPNELFINRLIAPVYCIGVAKWLIRQGVSLAVFGRGFEPYPELHSVYRSEVIDRETFNDVIRHSAGVINPFISSSHPIRAIDRPIVSTFGKTPQRILQDIQAIRSRRAQPITIENPLTRDLLFNLIKQA